jgi:hypothetical protein
MPNGLHAHRHSQVYVETWFILKTRTRWLHMIYMLFEMTSMISKLDSEKFQVLIKLPWKAGMRLMSKTRHYNPQMKLSLASPRIEFRGYCGTRTNRQ